MNVNKKYSYLAKNTLLFTIANLSNKLIVFFLLPFYTAYLSMEEYAIIDLISITQQLIFPIVTLDITEAVIRFGIEKYNVKSTIFTIGFIFTVSGNLILGIGCAAANSLFMDNSHFMLYFFVFNLVISVNTLLSSFLRTVDKVYVITIASIINTIIITILNILLISKYEMGIKGYYISYTIGNVVAIVIMCACVKLKEYLKKLIITDVHQYLVPMLKYAIPLIPNALFWWINSSLDRYFLTIMSTLSSVGMYAAANKLPSVLSTLTSIFQQSWGLSMFKENESSSKQEFFNIIYNLYNILIFGVSLVLILGSEYIARLLLSKDFFLAWSWIPWLVLGFYSNAISSFIGTEFTAAKKTYWILLTTLVSAIVNVFLNSILIPSYNGLGAAVATLISYFVLLEIRVFALNKKFDLAINNVKVIAEHALLIASVIVSINTSLMWKITCLVIVLIIFTFLNKKYIVYFIHTIPQKTSFR